MHIALAYLDKRTATVSAIKDYTSMEFIINNTPDEAKLAPQIGEMDIRKECYQRALEYMAWFRPAWDTLTDDERFVLSEFYREDEARREDAIDNIRDRFYIESTSTYKKKNRALAKLTTLLYGKIKVSKNGGYFL